MNKRSHINNRKIVHSAKHLSFASEIPGYVYSQHQQRIKKLNSYQRSSPIITKIEEMLFSDDNSAMDVISLFEFMKNHAPNIMSVLSDSDIEIMQQLLRKVSQDPNIPQQRKFKFYSDFFILLIKSNPRNQSRLSHRCLHYL